MKNSKSRFDKQHYNSMLLKILKKDMHNRFFAIGWEYTNILYMKTIYIKRGGRIERYSSDGQYMGYEVSSDSKLLRYDHKGSLTTYYVADASNDNYANTFKKYFPDGTYAEYQLYLFKDPTYFLEHHGDAIPQDVLSALKELCEEYPDSLKAFSFKQDGYGLYVQPEGASKWHLQI